MAKQKVLRVGTSSNNDIVINDPQNFVSKMHATLTHQGGDSYLLEDHSVNGTWVGGQKKHRESVYVQMGDHIYFAKPNYIELDWSKVQSTKGSSAGSNFKWWYAAIPLAILLIGVTALVARDNIRCLLTDCEPQLIACESEVCEPAEIEAAYRKSAAMIAMTYKWKLMDNVNNVPIYYIGLDSDAIQRGDRVSSIKELMKVSEPDDVENIAPFLTFGTGFYIETGIEDSGDGVLVTNRHVVKKIYDDDEKMKLGPDIYLAMDEIEKKYQTELGKREGIIKDSDVEWIPDFEYIYVAPYNSSFNLGNNLLDQITEVETKFQRADLLYHSSEYDVAAIKKLGGTPEDAIEIPRTAFNVGGKKSIESSTRATTIGFPIGNYQFNTLFSTGQTGGASQIVSQTRVGRLGTPHRDEFIFDNAAKGGQSGSPVFNEKGELIGVVFAVDGNDNTHCVHAREIVNEVLLPLKDTYN
jgi:S1-C subfamily serine protease